MSETATRPLTVRDAADRLGVSRGLVYALVRLGKIRHERHGTGRGTIRITEEALAEYRSECVREREREARPVKPARANGRRGHTTFGNLDSDRMLAAWKEQGAVKT